MKRLFIIAFTIVICISGCAKPEGDPADGEGAAVSGQISTAAGNLSLKQDDEGVDIASIISKQEAAMKEVNSCTTDVHMEINLKSEDQDHAAISVISDLKSDIDINARLIGSVITTRLSVAGKKNEMEQQIIVSGDNIFFNEKKASDTQGQWQLKSLDKASLEKLWNEQEIQLTGLKYSELMTFEGFVYTGDEKSNGNACFVLKYSLDWKSILEASPELAEQMQGLQGLMPEEIENMVENADVSFLIDKQTFHLREFHIEVRINQEIQGRQITGDIKQYYVFDAFNQPVSIDIPKNAEPVGESGQ